MAEFFYWTAKGLNWNAYGHNPASGDASAQASRYPRCQRLQYRDPHCNQLFRMVQDHNKRLAKKSVRDVATGGRVTCPIRTFSRTGWYGGTEPLSRSECDRPARPATGTTAAVGHDRELPHGRGWLAFYVALHNEREDYHQQYFPRWDADDDAGRFPEFVIDESN